MKSPKSGSPSFPRVGESNAQHKLWSLARTSFTASFSLVPSWHKGCHTFEVWTLSTARSALSNCCGLARRLLSGMHGQLLGAATYCLESFVRRRSQLYLAL